MIEGMIGAGFVILSFVSGYFFRGKQEKTVPVQELEQERQLPANIEEQLNNIANAWK